MGNRQISLAGLMWFLVAAVGSGCGGPLVESAWETQGVEIDGNPGEWRGSGGPGPPQPLDEWIRVKLAVRDAG
jgi:hypothetical protein